MEALDQIMQALVWGAEENAKPHGDSKIKNAYDELKRRLKIYPSLDSAIKRFESNFDDQDATHVLYKTLEQNKVDEDVTAIEAAKAVRHAYEHAYYASAEPPAEAAVEKPKSPLPPAPSPTVPHSSTTTNTGGGASVGGDVEAGRDFIGRDKVTYNINIGGNLSQQDMANIAKLMQRDTAPTLSETIRLDVAMPKEAVVGKTFRVGVAVKQPSSPPLKVKDLQNTASAQGEVLRSAADEIVRYKVEIIAPDCDIAEPKFYTFRLKAGTDSNVFFFTLTPKRAGMLDVLVNAYQEGDIVAASPIVIEAKVEVVDSQQSDNSTLSKIVELLDKYFSMGDIEGLCFDLGIDDENLEGETKIEKARALVTYCKSRDKLDALKSKMLDERPNLKGKL
jgi:hypothetical protein